MPVFAARAWEAMRATVTAKIPGQRRAGVLQLANRICSSGATLSVLLHTITSVRASRRP